MLTKETLTDLLSSPDVPRRDKVLLVLATSSDKPLPISDIRRIAVEAGLREIQKWNVADLLARARGYVARVKEGWQLSGPGRAHVKSDLLKQQLTSTQPSAVVLRGHLSKITNPDTREFVEEAIRCLEADLYRASVVFSWIGAVSVLYDYVLTNKLAEFNSEAKRRDSKWKLATTRDDLALMKESQ